MCKLHITITSGRSFQNVSTGGVVVSMHGFATSLIFITEQQQRDIIQASCVTHVV